MATIKHNARSVRKPCRYCGRTDGLYWWHETESDALGKRTRYCREHGEVTWYLGNAEGTRHECRPGAADQDHDEPVHMQWNNEPASVAQPAATPAPSAPASNGQGGSDDRLGALAQLIDLLAPKVDAQQVREIIDGELAKRIMPTVVELRKPDGSVKPVKGATHKALPKVIRRAQRGNHVLMVGPGGTGKSTIARQVAEALEVPFYEVSLGPTTPESRFVGYMTASGEYVTTLFRKAYESGGVFHFDEFDNGNASILAMLNNGLANGHMAFPDKMVERHPDFRCLASANTYGRGADRMYVGRQSLDVTTLDRFKVVTVEIDDALEEQVCQGTGASAPAVSAVIQYVRALRANVERHKMAFLVSPRASKGICEDVRDGENISESITENLRKGASDADWSKITAGVPLPSIRS